MASANIAFPQSRMPAPQMLARGTARPLPVHGMARFAFWTLFLCALTNAIGLYVTYVRNARDDAYMLGLFPVLFAVCATLVLAFTKPRKKSTILMFAWAFWLVFFLAGFLGSQQITGTYIRATLEVTLKPWMTLVGLPWLALRAISQESAPRFLRATVLITAIGAMLGLLQLMLPGFLQEVSDNSQRATGFWINPNTCGQMCVLALFISLVCPFRQKPLNWISRSLLIACVAASFSRSAVLTLVVGWIVYALATKRFGTLLKSAVALGIFIAALFFTLNTIEAVSPAQAERLRLFRSFLEGDWSADRVDNRTDLWKQTYLAIESKGGLVFGLGHGSMLKPVETRYGGLAPHNYYLYVFGNSGILSLLLLLVFEFVLFQQARKCPKREVRAGLLAMATVIALMHVFDHSFVGFPFAGVIFASVVIAVAYGKQNGTGAIRSARVIERPLRSNTPNWRLSGSL